MWLSKTHVLLTGLGHASWAKPATPTCCCVPEEQVRVQPIWHNDALCAYPPPPLCLAVLESIRIRVS